MNWWPNRNTRYADEVYHLKDHHNAWLGISISRAGDTWLFWQRGVGYEHLSAELAALYLENPAVMLMELIL